MVFCFDIHKGQWLFLWMFPILKFWGHRFCTLVCLVCTCMYLSGILLVITHTWIMNFSVLVFWALCFLYPEFCLPWPGMVYCLDFLPEWVRGSHQLLPHWQQGSFLVSFTKIGFFNIRLEHFLRMHDLHGGSACCACKLKTKSLINSGPGIEITYIWKLWWQWFTETHS